MAKKGLGKGLNSLFDIGGEAAGTPKNTVSVSKKASSKGGKSDGTGSTGGVGGVTYLRLVDVEPNRNQPRRSFDEEQINALAESIKENGLIQPIIVVRDGKHYKIAAGERRWRAARIAGLKEIPAIVREYSPEQLQEVALIENLQREDLNPIEEAAGYSALMSEYGMTQEEVSKKIGKSRSAVANSLRLLTLGDEIQNMLADGLLSSGHARAILSIEDKSLRLTLANRIIAEHLSVRQAEELSRTLKKKPKAKKTPNPDIALAAKQLSDGLSSAFGTRVTVKPGAKKGKIEIEYFGNDDLDRILGIMNYSNNA